MFNKLICKLKGHKTAVNDNDYLYCKRCGEDWPEAIYTFVEGDFSQKIDNYAYVKSDYECPESGAWVRKEPDQGWLKKLAERFLDWCERERKRN